MKGIGLSLWSHRGRSLSMGEKVKGAVFDVSEPGFVEAQGALASMVQGLRGHGIAFGQPQDSLDPP
jgi:hypothetical protein